MGRPANFSQPADYFKDLFDQMNKGYLLAEVIFDEAENPIDVHFIDANATANRISGIALAGKRMSVLNFDDQHEWFDIFGRVAKTGLTESLQFSSRVTGLYQYYALQAGAPKERKVALVFEELTKQMIADDTPFSADPNTQTLLGSVNLRKSEAWLTAVLEGIGEAFYALDEDWRFLFVSRAALKIWEKEPVDVFGRTFLDCFPLAAGSESYDAHRRVMVSRAAEHLETVSPVLNRWIEIDIAPMEQGGLSVAFRDIEQRKQADLLLRESEDRFKALAETSPLGVGVSSPEGKIIYTNLAYEAIIGCKPGSLIGKTSAIVYYDPAERQSWVAAMQGKGAVKGYEIRFKHADGHPVWVAINVACIDYGGKPAIIGVVQDITERRLAEEVLKDYNSRLENEIADRMGDLKESRDRTQSLLDTTLVQLSILEAVRDENNNIQDFEIKLINKELERQTGRRDLVGKFYAREFPGIRQAGIFDMIVKTIESGEPRQLEYFYHHDGFNRWFSSMFVKLGDGVVASNIDITDRKKAEDERFRNFVLLEQSEALAGSGSWDYDLLTGSFVWSDGMYRLFNLEKGIEVRPEIYLQYATADCKDTAARIVRHIENGDAEFDEIINIKVNNTIKVVKIKADIIKNAKGHSVRVLGVDMDMTATRAAEDKLRQMEIAQQLEIFRVTLNTQEEERRRISESLHNGVGQLLYGTRLAMNYLTVKTATENPGKFNESRAYTTSLLTDAIKDIRRISHELMPTVLAEFGLSAAIKDVCEQLQDGIRFECRVSPGDIKLENYVELAVFRTVQELMINVVKHAKATKSQVFVRDADGEVLIRVSDNGQGMVGGAEKPGIGLSSIRSKVDALKGIMDIQSAPGRGTVIEVKFPVSTSNE